MVTSLKQATPLRIPRLTPTEHLAAPPLGDLVMNLLSSCVLDSLVLVLLSGWLHIASYIYAGLCRRPGTMLAGLERESRNPDEVTGGLVGYKMKRDVCLELRNRKSMLMVWEAR